MSSPHPASLAAAAAVALGRPILEVRLERCGPVGAPLQNMTTKSILRVGATALTSTGAHAFGCIIKTIQSPLLWPRIHEVPETLHATLVEHYPWRTELDTYRSDLGSTLPQGMRMPRLYLAVEGPDSAELWLEDVTEDPGAGWDAARFEQAAYLLGAFAAGDGSTAPRDRDVRFFLDGPGDSLFIPMINSPLMTEHPALAACVDPPLLADLRAFTRRVHTLAEDLQQLPKLRAHGDATPHNLLLEPDGTIAAIDWGSFQLSAAGCDLGQLLAGRVNSGELDGAALAQLAPLCLAAYCRGLNDYGVPVPAAVVRRGFVLTAAVFSALTALCAEELREPPTEAVFRLMAGRAAMARYLLAQVGVR